MKRSESPSDVCGAVHPDHPEATCQREFCVVYHQAGSLVWMDGARSLPEKTSDPIRFAGILDRSRGKLQRMREGNGHEDV